MTFPFSAGVSLQEAAGGELVIPRRAASPFTAAAPLIDHQTREQLLQLVARRERTLAARVWLDRADRAASFLMPIGGGR